MAGERVSYVAVECGSNLYLEYPSQALNNQISVGRKKTRMSKVKIEDRGYAKVRKTDIFSRTARG
jgi:hypothetical protein